MSPLFMGKRLGAPSSGMSCTEHNPRDFLAGAAGSCLPAGGGCSVFPIQGSRRGLLRGSHFSSLRSPPSSFPA